MCVIENSPTLSLDLPLEITDFADMFEEKEAEQLPLHRPYDCPIDLVPNAKLPVSWIYFLSERELETFQDFIEKNLKKDRRHPH